MVVNALAWAPGPLGPRRGASRRVAAAPLAAVAAVLGCRGC